METKDNIFRQQSFELFVSSVLRQKASEENREIQFEAPLPLDMAKNTCYLYDAVAPYGFGRFTGPVIFEYKYNLNSKSISKLPQNLASQFSVAKTYVDVTVIVITNVQLDHEIYQHCDNIYSNSNGIEIIIWGKKVIDEWVKQYPIDYSNAIASAIGNNKDSLQLFEITESDFLKKSEHNIELLSKTIKKDDCFALVLGAGISVDPGAMSWKKLLLYFESQLEAKGVIEDSAKLCDKIGNSSITTAQLCKELYKNDRDYYWEIHKELYENSTPLNQNYSIWQIARIIKENKSKRHFRVLTYNFDEYLEKYLDDISVTYNSLFDSKCSVDDRTSIYHVHGFLPKVDYKSHMQQRHMRSIYLTEEDYNELYNHPYSWQISSQLSFFRENTCLFVGCSLADPNIRRLLEMTKQENRIHYAILTRDSLSLNDLMVASNHFARLGIEVIWVKDFKDIYYTLKLL